MCFNADFLLARHRLRRIVEDARHAAWEGDELVKIAFLKAQRQRKYPHELPAQTQTGLEVLDICLLEPRQDLRAGPEIPTVQLVRVRRETISARLVWITFYIVADIERLGEVRLLAEELFVAVFAAERAVAVEALRATLTCLLN